jgi:quercetin dioxygenase-like cupin family protein
MKRLLTAFTILLAAGGFAIAHDAETNESHDGESVKLIAQHLMSEKLDGEDATASVVEVTIAPGKEGLAHRHPGPGIVYVIEGTYELGIDDKPTEIFKAGESFYEPGGCLHRVSRNPSKTEPTKLVAIVLHPRDAKEVAIPEPQQK